MKGLDRYLTTPPDEIMPPGLIECPECCGVGKLVLSCCGDDITYNDYDNCPTCCEHCGDTDPHGDCGEDCPNCEGTGKIAKPCLV